MRIHKLFQKTRFGVFVLFGFIGLSTSLLCVYTVDKHLSEEYEVNCRNISKTIANSSMDILLNRDLSTLQSLIDQFTEIQGIEYIYVRNESGEFLAHTFVPGIPQEIKNGDPSHTGTIHRTLHGMGDYVEVGSKILAGVGGTVRVGMDRGLIALKIQAAIGQQIYLISIIFVIGIVATVWFINFAAKPLAELLSYAIHLAKDDPDSGIDTKKLLERDDEVGQMARLFLYFSQMADKEKKAKAVQAEESKHDVPLE
ncbi:MAG: HAMP domain-containing protein [Candidatus Electrothrix sp. AR3]|nr:HAMP domain-containing protein [Candidatus Electrothrix sp. AR3]